MIPVGILGATGAVGQTLIERLHGHPWFEITSLAASNHSVGKRIEQLEIQACQPNLPCSLVFSALNAQVAGDIETQFAQAGYIVISNARNHRMDPDVPLIIPEVNGDHLQLKSRIVTNPNCTTTGLALALKPLHEHFAISNVHVVSLQAISGAGSGANLDIEDNIIPFIRDEEQKLESETLKIFGCTFPISASCNRVHISDGHLLCISVTLQHKAEKEDLIQAWESFRGLKLPTAPQKPIYYFQEDDYPQPKIHRLLEKGMAISIGRLRKCSVLDYKFIVLVHNTIRGAAGGAILNGELLSQKYGWNHGKSNHKRSLVL